MHEIQLTAIPGKRQRFWVKAEGEQSEKEKEGKEEKWGKERCHRKWSKEWK